MSCHAEPYKIVINSYSKYYSQLSVRYRYRCHECQLWSGVIRHLGQSKGPIAANPANTSSAGTRVTKICGRQCPMQTDPKEKEWAPTRITLIHSMQCFNMDFILNPSRHTLRSQPRRRALKIKHCQRHNGREGWVHITSSSSANKH